ncbi:MULTISPECIES: acetyl/propionyl/methylcrotonyl-CoA carboxylase subunit alpha [unclassified Nocardioides]|uniref:acetyl/propionyl/methylcrotonyl-CoA carboxylase subunit alpha n=1 Tax=unclassified Nocardioides TaxID=2615069 RepID=UPI0006F9277F|nr:MULTISPECIES: biotin carboxylase N-terminal domain-containing protein [unclassified Nocardioides]KQY57504.1 carbamoyl-phosphate synthase subunit L [Nocardioides sp. Root140]KRF20298.1 carbamoyl-phosphate synthase subunit L [Nocardioides sp. Soil796]
MKTLLIANRGEIALRVIGSARALGIRTVAIHTDLDATAPHVREADHAVRVEAYLDIDAVVQAAKDSGAEAIHPGYGFLSERAEFARAVEQAGLTLVGPSADVMDRMGRKDAAREVAIAAGVPVVPSYGIDDDPASMNYPILVKAAAGGGGKGMRIVRAADEFEAAVAAAKREAAKSFGDDTMLIEKYVERGRHIEVQVMADSHGNVVHLFERDCSTQRRHQKVLEEAPAPTIDEATRALITGASVALSKQVGYVNAGTVEFLLDADTGEAYFLEMNTRLQVEHPVTESVVACTPSGDKVDLVAVQLAVASGEELPFTQDDLWLDGHAIEARVYAEDPYSGFLPQAGNATLVRWPVPPFEGTRDGMRVDAALESNQVVSTSFDPMLGKVIAVGKDREEARRQLVTALERTSILGLTTNTGFLREIAESDAFRDAEIDSAWLDRHPPTAPDPSLARTIAAWTDVAIARLVERPGPLMADGWRDGGPAVPTLVELDQVVRVDRAAGLVDDTRVVERSMADHVASLRVDGQRIDAVVNAQEHGIDVALRGQRFNFERPDVFGDHGPVVGDGTLLAPMPGTVLAVNATSGQEVKEGDVLGTMEAMKMELALKAPFDGTVVAVHPKVGEQVPLGAVLFEVEASA